MTASTTSVTQRSHERQTLDLPVQFRVGANTVEARARNMSAGGMFIETPTPLPTGARAFFNLRPTTDQLQFNLEAEVVWTKRKHKGMSRKFTGMGVRFLASHAQNEKTVNGILELFGSPSPKP